MMHASDVRNMVLSTALLGAEDIGITLKDYEDLIIENQKLKKENKKLKKELEEYKLYEDDYIA